MSVAAINQQPDSILAEIHQHLRQNVTNLTPTYVEGYMTERADALHIPPADLCSQVNAYIDRLPQLTPSDII
jgi:hypothetical protein